MEPSVVLLGLAVLAGAVTQSVVGFGMSVVAAPFVVLVAPDLMPVALLVPSVTLPVLQLGHGVRDLARRPLGLAFAARLVLTPVGVAAVAVLAPRAIAALVGVLILVTVALSVRTIDLRPTPRNALVAGAVSGRLRDGRGHRRAVPRARALQHERPTRVRSTLAAFFLVGSGLALGAGPRRGGQRAAAADRSHLGTVRTARLRAGRPGPRPGRPRSLPPLRARLLRPRQPHRHPPRRAGLASLPCRPPSRTPPTPGSRTTSP